jgi:hypothetical protein
MSTRITRAGAALVIAVALSGLAGPAAAATPAPMEDFSYAERGVTGFAYWESCAAPDSAGITRCTTDNVFVFDGRQRSNDPFGRVNTALTYLCVYHQSVAFAEDGSLAEEPTAEQGCIDDPQLAIADPLESITVSADALVLTEELCVEDHETGEVICEPGSTRTVAVEATFVGIGPLVADRWNHKDHTIVDGQRCTFRSSGSGTRREAEASVSVDGGALGPPAYAELADGKMRFAQRCSG